MSTAAKKATGAKAAAAVPTSTTTTAPVPATGNAVLRSGETKPARVATLVGSAHTTCAYIRVKLTPDVAYRWEEWQDAEKKYPMKFRVLHPEAVVSLSRAMFEDLFPGV